MGGRGASLLRAWRNNAARELRIQQLSLEFSNEMESMALESFNIGRSVGAKALNYNVKDYYGNIYHFTEGTSITGVEVFAGKGVRKKLKPEVVDGLHRQHGGRPKNWQHVKGYGFVDYHGKSLPVEVHWFQEASVGRVQFRIKEWLDEG